jgi:hypothetical protein
VESCRHEIFGKTVPEAPACVVAALVEQQNAWSPLARRRIARLQHDSIGGFEIDVARLCGDGRRSKSETGDKGQ